METVFNRLCRSYRKVIQLPEGKEGRGGFKWVTPHFAARGKVKQVDFWLLFKAVGYHEGFQHSHAPQSNGFHRECPHARTMYSVLFWQE